MSDQLPRQLSRGEFFKLAGLGAASVFGLAFSEPIKELDRASIEIEQEKSFETDNAIYTPFFETHTYRNSDQRILDTKPKLLFIEFASQTDYELNGSPFEILNLAENEEGLRFFSDGLLYGLTRLQTKVSIEAVRLPPELKKHADIIRMSSFALPSLTTVASLGVALGRLAKKGEFSKGDNTRIYSSILATLWARSDELTISGLGSYDTNEDSPEIRNAQNVANRINATVSFTHPEYTNVFMRNILMASKIITVAEQPDIGDEKTNTAFRMGAAHGLVSDLIKVGKPICHTMLGVYSNDVLRQVIEYNTSPDKVFRERVGDFCKVIVIPAQEAGYKTRVRYVVDNELKYYILNRFDLPQK